MTTRSFRDIRGLPVFATTNAARIGNIEHLMIAAEPASVKSVDLGAGDAARIVDFDALTFGEDAVTLDDLEARREPDDREKRAIDGELDLLGKLVLDEGGDAHGNVESATFDPETGRVVEIRCDVVSVDPGGVRAVGSFALVVEKGAVS